jgi:hypothetical protein
MAEAMTIKILECAAVHEAHVLRLMQLTAAGLDRRRVIASTSLRLSNDSA